MWIAQVFYNINTWRICHRASLSHLPQCLRRMCAVAPWSIDRSNTNLSIFLCLVFFLLLSSFFSLSLFVPYFHSFSLFLICFLREINLLSIWGIRLWWKCCGECNARPCTFNNISPAEDVKRPSIRVKTHTQRHKHAYQSPYYWHIYISFSSFSFSPALLCRACMEPP